MGRSTHPTLRALLAGPLALLAACATCVAVGTPAIASDQPIGVAVPAPTAAERASDVPADEIGGALALHATSEGTRTIVMVDDAPTLDRVLLSGIAALDVWRDGFFGFVAGLDATTQARLRATPGVRSVEPDQPIHAEQANPPWGLDRIDQATLPLDGSYDPAATGLGVTAYLIDSGLWLSHTEFTGRVADGAYIDFGDGLDVWDCTGHGTHVAGILGGSTYGVAKQVTLVPVRVLDCHGGGSVAQTIAGINWVIDHHAAGTPAVANMSVGGSYNAGLNAAVAALIADGVTVVAAAGNDATDTCTTSPGSLPQAITVAASDQGDADADFSNYGSCNDLFAPGVGITSAWAGSNTATNTISGTSMAAPHVAGAAALVLQSAPSSSPAQVWATLDAWSTKGELSTCCGDPDKLLYVPRVAPAGPVGTELSTVQPARLYDSRSSAGPRPARSITEVQVAGLAGVPADATLAALNVTALDPQAPGYFTVFPCGTAPPNASNLNFRARQTIPNAAVVRIGAGGKVCVYTSATAGLLVDVDGYVPSTSHVAALDPFRLYDSRASGQPRPAGSITEVQVAGAGGVDPAAAAALLNVTAVDAVSAGYLTVFPCGSDPPNASNLNFTAGQTIANSVLGRIGSGGRICIYTSAAAGLLVDVNGGVATGTAFAAVDPVRLHDSRASGQPVPGGTRTIVQVAGRGGVPAGATTALLNVTATEATGAGYLTVYPCGASLPNASNLNVAPGDTIPNAVVAKLSPDGKACVYTSVAAGIVVDVDGYAT